MTYKTNSTKMPLKLMENFFYCHILADVVIDLLLEDISEMAG